MTPTFADYVPPVPPPGEQPLAPTLPMPPVMFVGGRRHDLERVDIATLDTWRQARGLRLARVSWCGRLGWVSVYERENDGRTES